MKAPKVYSLFDPPADAGVDCSAASLPDDATCRGARQADKDDADINVIMARAERQPDLIPFMVGNRVGSYLDVSDAPETFWEAKNIVLDAEARFSELPARVRSRFANDPFELLQFLQDPANRSEAEELGLIKKADAEEPAGPVPKADAGKPPEGGAPVAQ